MTDLTDLIARVEGVERTADTEAFDRTGNNYLHGFFRGQAFAYRQAVALLKAFQQQKEKGSSS